MSLLLDAVLAQAANGSPTTVTLSSESVAVLLLASGLLEQRQNWLDKAEDPMDEVTDVDWDIIEKIVGGAYFQIMNPDVGAVFPYITSDPPISCLPCDGATYDREDYPLLYEAIDPAFIIDGDTFFVPNLNGRTIIGAGESDEGTTFDVGEIGGEETHELVEAEIATHTHIDSGHSHAIAGTTSGLAVSPGELPVVVPIPLVPSLTGTSSAVIQDAGGGEPHNNMQPFMAIKYCVRAS